MSQDRRQQQGYQVAHVVCAVTLMVASLTALSPQATAYRETLAGTTVSFEMVPVPGGTVTVGGTTHTVAPFFVGRTEVTWDLYDVFMLGLDGSSSSGGADAIARPSQPYGAPDYGWGHAGFPAISVARTGAEAFATWLSKKTGREYRLPTDIEWMHLSRLAAGADGEGRMESLAWHRGNAGGRTHAVATRTADALGLFDLFGNAAEWVTSADGALMVMGGSFKDAPTAVGPTARAIQDGTWNERDPQLPKSRWWLSDGPFVGFRLVTTRTP